MAKNILVVDDEQTLREMLGEALTAEGYHVLSAANLQQGRDAFEDNEVALVVLDIMLPGENGIDLLEWMRHDKNLATPVILLTGVSAEADKLRAFELGADDYVVKPFSVKEFTARIAAVVRRSESNTPDIIEFGSCIINRGARTVTREGKELKLRLKEYQILTKLAEQPGVAINRKELFTAIWGDDSPSHDKTVDVTIHTLREKVEEDPANPQFIQTVRGFGYRFHAPHGS